MIASFIVPCFNVSGTVKRCLDSIYSLALSENDYEVIAVDDGSSDDTLEKLKEYASSHSNLKIIKHLVNRSLGAARNSGLAEAKGQFIVFVDSDDEIGPGVKVALDMAKTRDLEMVAMLVHVVDEKGKLIEEMSLSVPEDRLLTGIELLVEYPSRNQGSCFYVFSRSFMDRVRYPFVEGTYYEDVDFVCRHLFAAERIGYCATCGYQYFMNNSSITHSFSVKHVYGLAYLGSRLIDLSEEFSHRNESFSAAVFQRGSYFLWDSFRKMINLDTKSDMRTFYHLVDMKMDRHHYLKMSKWNKWTRLCLGWKEGAILLAGIKRWQVNRRLASVS